jgi:Rieske Fe-S protein
MVNKGGSMEGGSDKTHDAGDEVAARSDADPDRRDFLSTFSTVAMAGGLLAGYGTFAIVAGRYVFPTNVETPWLFVAEANSIQPGDSLAFESPTGVRVAIARRPAAGLRHSAQTEDFIALSSVCPHLGCRVHWEPHNHRFFCPCHNGVFNPEGKPVSGPPKAAEQELSRYPLKVERGLLFIAMSVESVGSSGKRSHGATAHRTHSPPNHSRAPEDLA